MSFYRAVAIHWLVAVAAVALCFGGANVLPRALGISLTVSCLAVVLFRLVRSRSQRPSEAAARSPLELFGIVAILLLSLVLRWPIASLDVEHYLGPDEGEVVENVLEMIKTGDWDHRHRGYPGLHFYLQILPAKAHLWWSEGAEIPELDRWEFYLAARRFSLLLGWLTAAVVFLTARSQVSPFAAFLASALVALSPLALRESAVVNPDLVLGFFVALSLYAVLRLTRSPTCVSFLFAGVTCGLSTAIKYTGGLTLFPLLVAWLTGTERTRHVKKVVFALIAGFVTFALTSPYTFLKIPEFLGGLGRHFGYYRADDMNAPLELTRLLLTRGLGPVAVLAALGLGIGALARCDSRGLILLSYPVATLFVFSFFERAFPRHALPLLPSMALLGAAAAPWVAERLAVVSRSTPPRLAFVALIYLAPSVSGSVALAVASQKPTPAERASQWVTANLPVGSRVLEDQFTPRLDPSRYRVHRLRVEEKRFVGNFDWVLVSGYPPGLHVDGLRQVAEFETGEGLGAGIRVFQVGDRESLMPITNLEGGSSLIRAGDLMYFGEGWHPPEPGAFATSRVSQGESSEIFFRLGPPPLGSLVGLITMCQAVAGESFPVQVELSGSAIAKVELDTTEPRSYELEIPASRLEAGLNRLLFRYARTARLNRRYSDTGLRFFSLRLEAIAKPEEAVSTSR
ncbi:MAG TPA: glycosyltransferase family 39 protein [Vicinamibacteria bacterium]|nr:glycosyltransferase family 39 protein [Vicinamibacteria bacterium]